MYTYMFYKFRNYVFIKNYTIQLCVGDFISVCGILCYPKTHINNLNHENRCWQFYCNPRYNFTVILTHKHIHKHLRWTETLLILLSFRIYDGVSWHTKNWWKLDTHKQVTIHQHTCVTIINYYKYYCIRHHIPFGDFSRIIQV